MAETSKSEQTGSNKIEVNIIDERSRELQRIILEDPRVIELLSQLDQHHHDTYLHSLRVGLLSIDIGYEEQLDENQIEVLGYAANLHDIGKTEMALSLLDKKDKLTETERSEMNKHVNEGISILRASGMKVAKRILAQHHEYQPESYPRSQSDRKKEYLGKEKRSNNSDTDHLGEILAISDMVDALTSARAYKEPLSREEVEIILRSDFSGDPSLIEKVLSRLNPNSPSLS